MQEFDVERLAALANDAEDERARLKRALQAIHDGHRLAIEQAEVDKMAGLEAFIGALIQPYQGQLEESPESSSHQQG